MRRNFLLAFIAIALLGAGLSAALSASAATRSFQELSRLHGADTAQRGAGRVVGGPERRAEREAALLSQLWRAHLWAALLSGLLAVAVGLALAARLTLRLRQLEQASRRYAAGERKLALPEEGKDEVAQLARAFRELTQQLDEKRQREQALLADIAHELRAPLTVVRGSLEALEDGVYEPSPARFRELTEEVDSLSRLVGDLRMLSLAEVGQLPLEKRVLAFDCLVSQRLKAFQMQAEAKGVTLQMVIKNPPAPEIKVVGDAGRLEQVINNLLANAIHHSPPLSTVQAALKVHDGWIELSVSDQGKGFLSGEEEQVFHRFYRKDSARRREDGGTGLGLSIAKALVTLHGGHIQASNAPAGGALLLVRLPLWVPSPSEEDTRL